ncbi:hypothetical protein [Nannocystis punicea]|uniref:Tc toxin complex TcA C-terminal TcB-binding domain-containing protein n=1 Tax=Nannocystis punicea TaxID=2995304 RepID=A0ABY7GYE1_9BACT|nr:hypothetical protein [Nannocystis poenicansa]WAS91839.1 hypothetical protein O0S08_37120 [Nannocystis poenicansa]
MLPVQIVAGGGTLLWSIEVEGLPQPGYFEGALQHEAGDVGLGSAALALELDFRDDGTIAGRVRGDASPLWPLPVVVTGTWTAGGDVVVVLRDRLPAEDWRHSPIARELGREFVLSGKHTADQIAGSVHETLTGMRPAPVELEGSFVLRRRGPLGGLVLPAAYVPEDATAPAWLAPPSLDFEACALLGKSFGTDQTLVEPSAACSACATGGCPAADRIECAGALREATFNIDAVLAPLQGGQDVSPPAGSDTWTDCTAETPNYGDDGRTCLDIDGMRCAHALFRTGAAQTPGPWGEAFSHMAATFSADEGRAATLLALETEVDVALSFKDSLGEPVADALAREQKLLASSRTRLAAALAPTLAPVYPSSLEWLADNADYDSLARARTIPLELLAQYARATAAWARLGHRAGQDAADLRAAVRLGMIAMHAASAELAERLADEANAAPGLQALGSVLDTLAGAYAELAEGGSRFGYPAAYVPLALDQADITEGRTNFEAVRELATGDLELLEQITAEAWQAIRDYETKSHGLAATALRIQDEYGSKLRGYCGSLPGENAPNLATCGDHGGQIAELRANIEATTLRINHAAQAVQNNLDAVEVEEQRFAAELAAHEELEQAVADAQGKIINVVTYYGTARSAAEQAAAIAECTRVRASANAEYQSLIAGCKQQTQQALLSGPGVFGFSTPDWRGLVLARDQCEAQKAAHVAATDNQCESIMANAELAGEMDELSRNEDLELRMINAEMDAIIRAGELNVRRAESEARVKNLRSEALLLQIEVKEAELARDTAMTAMSSAFQEVGALLIDQANAVGLLVDDSPDNPLKRPNFLAARLAAAGRVLPAREQTMRRVYLALRALEYHLNQEFPTLRGSLAAARAPADFVDILACLDTIAEDYRLEQGAPQAYVTEVSLRADIFGMTSDIPDVDGSPATPAEQFAALLADPLHRAPDGSVHLPFTLSAFEHALFSASLCDDRLEQVEVKLIGD